MITPALKPAPRNCVNKTPSHRSKHKAAAFATPEAQLEGTESEEEMEFGGHSESEVSSNLNTSFFLL